jgi:hypothetical protein
MVLFLSNLERMFKETQDVFSRFWGNLAVYPGGALSRPRTGENLHGVSLVRGGFPNTNAVSVWGSDFLCA